MFLTCLRRELRRRMRQAIVISVGLALGIGLVTPGGARSSARLRPAAALARVG